MSTQYSSPEAYKAINSFVPPDALKVSPKCTDLAAAFQDYRHVMFYHSRLILVLVRTAMVDQKTLHKLAPTTEVQGYTLVCVLLVTNGRDFIHLDKKVWDGPHCEAIREQVEDVYDELMNNFTITNVSRNFRIMHICIGHELFKLDTMAKENDRQFLADGGAFVKECVPNFIHEQDVLTWPEYTRSAHAYYTSRFRVLMRFIVTHLDLIVEDVGIPELLPLVEEDRKDDNRYNFITLEKQSQRMLQWRKEALEAELLMINIALGIRATSDAEDDTD